MRDYLNPQIRVRSLSGAYTVTNLMPLSQILLQTEKVVQIPYHKRTVFLPYHRRTQRFAIIVAHRRAGKTVAEINEGIRKIMRCTREQPPPQVAFISPTYGQGKRNAWQYAKYYSKPIPGVKVGEAELTITFPNGGRYMFAGSDNYDALRGIYLDHASLDEFGFQHQKVWGDIIRPVLDRGGSATFIGSANGRNHFWDLLKQHEDDPEWYISILRASQTGIISEEELASIRKTVDESQYLREYECNFEASVKGAYYGKEIAQAEIEGRICNMPYDKAAPVYCGWDLGLNDHMALWTFQVIGKSWVFLDYYANYNQDYTHYVNWANSRPYRITTHFLPHDAKQRAPETGKTRISFLEGLELECEMVPKIANINDGINAVRMMLNRCWWNKPTTVKGVDAMRMYESEFVEEDKVLRPKPKHNWASHGADAFRTCVLGIEEMIKSLSPAQEEFGYNSEGWMG